MIHRDKLMKVLEKSQEHVVLAIAISELQIINNALNEVCNALPQASFGTRMGASLTDVRRLLGEVNALLPELADGAQEEGI
jgi:hypothetical protein